MADPPVPVPPKPPARPDRAKTIAAGLLGAVAALFALLNLDKVKVDWIVSSSRAPLIFVIVLCFALGVAVGALAARRAARK